MEAVTGYEQEQTVSQADIEAIPHTEIRALSPEESAQKLQELQGIESPTPRVRDLIKQASMVRGTEQIDRTVAAMRRLGVFGTEAGVPDPTFGSEQLKALPLSDENGFTFSFESSLADLREHKIADTGQEFTDWLDRGMSAGSSSYNRLVELSALAVASGALKELHRGGKGVPAAVELAAPDDVFRARNEALAAKIDELYGEDPKTHTEFFRDVAAAREQATERVRQAASHEAQVNRARQESERQAAETRKVAAKAEIDRLYLAPASEGGYADNLDTSQRYTIYDNGVEIGRDLLDRNEAHDLALREDHESALMAGDEQLQRLADAVNGELNPKVKADLQKHLQSYKEQLKKSVAEIDSRAAKIKAEVAVASGKHETEHRLDRTAPYAEFAAKVNREALGVLAEPFLEVKKGGLLHRKANRGPRVLETYYSHPNNPYLILVERRAQKNGELISQTTFTTERPTRDKGWGRILPPRGFMVRMDLVRQQDRLSGGYKSTLGDYLPGAAEWSGWRNDSGGALLNRPKRKNGGWIYWLFGERT